jgi:hypothetical protein
MAVIATGIMLWFRYKGWIGHARDEELESATPAKRGDHHHFED